MANMAEETWWNLSKNLFGLPSPCSLGANDVANFDWPSNDMKNSRSSDGSTGFSSPDDWNRDFFHGGGRTGDNSSYNSSMSCGGGDSNLISSFKQADEGTYPLQQHPANPISTSNDFPLNHIPASYNSYTTSLLQTLFDDTDNFDPPQQPTLDHSQPAMNNFSNYDQMNVPRDLIVPSFSSPGVDPSFSRQRSANTKTNHVKRVNEEGGNLGSLVSKKSNNEPAMKRARIVTPSPLPTFKVRKEKLGDRVTALQQLVSPFGKTDTASVLHEAIEYIKFLHDQVSVLSTPYLKNGPPLQQHMQVPSQEGPTQDLKARGLCLVPISSTFPVTTETSADFWSPFFGDCFK